MINKTNVYQLMLLSQKKMKERKKETVLIHSDEFYVLFYLLN